MSTLFLLQYSCAIVFLILALILMVSRLQQNTQNKQYRRSRGMLTLSMVLLVVHYVLQMQFSLRESSDAIGTVVNIVFYVPVAFLVSYSIVEMECNGEKARRFAWIGSVDCLVTVLAFLAGWVYYGSLHMPLARHALYFLFVASMIYYILDPLLSMRGNHKRIVDNTGGDIAPYSRYSWATYIMLCMISFTLVFAIVYRPLLYVVGPLMLVSLFLFVQSFVALGYDLASIEDVLSDDGTDETAEAMLPAARSMELPTESMVAASSSVGITRGEQVACVDSVVAANGKISRLLDGWVAEGGFRDSTINMAKLAQLLLIPRRDLSRYFDMCLNSTFRVWLSDIRFAEAQRLIRQHPEYSNDNISSGCGFSSRSQLYKIFSDKTGMTPREWREQQEQTQN